MMNHALKKIETAHKEILRGDTSPSPYRRGTETGCDYCKYRHVCGFDLKVPGYRYRDIGKMSKEEAVAAMRKAAGSMEKSGELKDGVPGNEGKAPGEDV